MSDITRFNFSRKYIDVADEIVEGVEQITGSRINGQAAAGVFYKILAERILYNKTYSLDELMELSGLDATTCTWLMVSVKTSGADDTRRSIENGKKGAAKRKDIIKPVLSPGMLEALDDFDI